MHVICRKLEWVLRRITMMRIGLWTKLYEEHLKQFGIFCLEKRKIWGNVIAIFKYMEDDHTEAWQN